MLEFLISQLPQEWEIFAQNEGVHPTELYEEVVKGGSKAQQDRVREWASHRSQSVIRTVNGAVHYHRALKVLLQREEGKEEAVGFEEVRRHAQLIMAHQTYGKLSLGKSQQVKIQHGVITSNQPHGLKSQDRVRLTLDALNAEDGVAKRAMDKIWKSRAMAKMKQRAKTKGVEVDHLLSDGVQVQALVEAAMSEPQEEAAEMAKVSTDQSKVSDGTGSGSTSMARHPALLGRLWGQAQVKGLQGFRSGRFYTVQEVVDEHTAILTDTSVNTGTARLEKAELTKREHDVHYMLSDSTNTV